MNMVSKLINKALESCTSKRRADEADKAEKAEIAKTVNRVSELLRAVSEGLRHSDVRKKIASECAENYYDAIRRVLDRSDTVSTCSILAPFEVALLLPKLTKGGYLIPGLLRTVSYTTRAQFVEGYSHLFEGGLSMQALSCIHENEVVEKRHSVINRIDNMYRHPEEQYVPQRNNIIGVLNSLDRVYRTRTF